MIRCFDLDVFVGMMLVNTCLALGVLFNFSYDPEACDGG